MSTLRKKQHIAIFEEKSVDELEGQIDDWLRDEHINFVAMTQTYDDANGLYCISIFYEED
jgi:hypothetical protein